jgi:hypothetical protein
VGEVLGLVGGVRVVTYAQRNDYPILSNDPLEPDQVEVHFQEGLGMFGARLSLTQLDAAMKVPTYLRSKGDINYWFGRGHVYGTYSNSLTPLDVLRFHNQRSRADWAAFRETALLAHGMDVAPVADCDACDECGQSWLLDPFWSTPPGSESTKPIPYFLCFECEERREA